MLRGYAANSVDVGLEEQRISTEAENCLRTLRRLYAQQLAENENKSGVFDKFKYMRLSDSKAKLSFPENDEPTVKFLVRQSRILTKVEACIAMSRFSHRLLLPQVSRKYEHDDTRSEAIGIMLVRTSGRNYTDPAFGFLEHDKTFALVGRHRV